MSESENPVIPSPEPKGHRPQSNRDWWPNQLDLSGLRSNGSKSDPMDPDFDYATEFATVDLEALKNDLI